MGNERPVVFDDDNPEWTEEDFARAKPASALHPPEVLALLVRKPGRPTGWRKANAKQSVTLRLSPDVLAALKAGGKGWQVRVDEMLRRDLGLNGQN